MTKKRKTIIEIVDFNTPHTVSSDVSRIATINRLRNMADLLEVNSKYVKFKRIKGEK